MFTGIIEEVGTVLAFVEEQSNVHYTIACDFVEEIKIDQSIAHNGCCLTVVEIVDAKSYKVTAIKETLNKTNLKNWKTGTKINLERCVQMNGRLDGHIVQGHVDSVVRCLEVKDQQGSWDFVFETTHDELLVNKGSITLNGVSLTVVEAKENTFSVSIIPYTFEHTNFHTLKQGDLVNVEYDIIGKYVQKMLAKANQ
jgi:riboflavin synthase